MLLPAVVAFARSLHAAKPNSHLRYGIAGEVHPSAEIFDDRCMTLRSSFIMGLRAETCSWKAGVRRRVPGDQFPKPCRAPLRCTTVTPNVRFVLDSGANADLSGGPSCADCVAKRFCAFERARLIQD